MDKMMNLVKRMLKAYKNAMNNWGNALLKATPYGIA